MKLWQVFNLGVLAGSASTWVGIIAAKLYAQKLKNEAAARKKILTEEA